MNGMLTNPLVKDLIKTSVNGKHSQVLGKIGAFSSKLGDILTGGLVEVEPTIDMGGSSSSGGTLPVTEKQTKGQWVSNKEQAALDAAAAEKKKKTTMYIIMAAVAVLLFMFKKK
jgi:hypothetical protein